MNRFRYFALSKIIQLYPKSWLWKKKLCKHLGNLHPDCYYAILLVICQIMVVLFQIFSNHSSNFIKFNECPNPKIYIHMGNSVTLKLDIENSNMSRFLRSQSVAIPPNSVSKKTSLHFDPTSCCGWWVALSQLEAELLLNHPGLWQTISQGEILSQCSKSWWQNQIVFSDD